MQADPIRVWIVTTAEPLPTDNGARLMRHGILAERLVSHGHSVTWWTSTFNHRRKVNRYNHDTSLDISDDYQIRLLHSVGYKRNLSLARIRNQREIASKFLRQSAGEPPPDIILCSFPTIDLSASAIRYGLKTGVPVILDVRDMWPDIFLDLLPKKARWAARPAIYSSVRQTQFAMKNASGIVAVSNGMLHWAAKYGGRAPGSTDAMLPLGYARPTCSPNEMESAGQKLREMGIKPGNRICWFIGQFGWHYDVSTVIDAARICKKRELNDVQFVLSGDGDQYGNLLKQAEGLDNVVFTGWVATPQIAYMMSVASVGLAAIHHNNDCNMPNKLFEYFSAGLPVLSSLPGEADELLSANNCGLTYKMGNAIDFVDKLNTLLADESMRMQMSANASRLYQSRFSAEVVYSDMEKYLLKMAGRHS